MVLQSLLDSPVVEQHFLDHFGAKVADLPAQYSVGGMLWYELLYRIVFVLQEELEHFLWWNRPTILLEGVQEQFHRLRPAERLAVFYHWMNLVGHLVQALV